MPWTYANAEQTIATDGTVFVPLNQPTQDSRDLAAKILIGLVIGPYVPPAVGPAQYTVSDLQSMLVQKGVIPAPVSASVTPSKVV